jgi:regulator of RNase E activity RraA/predicted enzyme related to lactoylglutathione lyase
MAPGPDPNAGGFEPLYDLLSSDLTGAAVVIAGAAAIPGAVWGEILTRAAGRAGAVCALVEGAVRDTERLRTAGLPIWALAEHTGSAIGLAHIVAIDVPVQVGEAVIHPGDTVVGDVDGVVSLGSDGDRLLAEGRHYAAAEARVMADLAHSKLSEAYRHKREASADIRARARQNAGNGLQTSTAGRHQGGTVMSPPAVGSILVGSSRADEMKRWYRRAFGATENEMGAFDLGPVQLFIEPHSDVEGPTREPARIIINLNVEDCRALEEHLNDLGVHWIRKVELMPFGLIGTVADPDGNYVQTIQWGATPEAHRTGDL